MYCDPVSNKQKRYLSQIIIATGICDVSYRRQGSSQANAWQGL
jgi:hypothetical protein